LRKGGIKEQRKREESRKELRDLKGEAVDEDGF